MGENNNSRSPTRSGFITYSIGNRRLSSHHIYVWVSRQCYYMAESASEQDEVNPAFWLATRAGEMGPPYLLGFSRVGPARKKFTFWPYNKSFIDQACSVKRAELCPNPFWPFYRPRSIKTQKKRLGRYSAIVTSRLINNAYICQPM